MQKFLTRTAVASIGIISSLIGFASQSQAFTLGPSSADGTPVRSDGFRLSPNDPNELQPLSPNSLPNRSPFVTAGGNPKWGGTPLGSASVVTYSFMAAGLSCSFNYSGSGATDCGTGAGETTALAIGFQNQVRNAFAAWSAVAGLTFTEVADGGGAVNAAGPAGSLGNIRVGTHDIDGPSGILAYAYSPVGGGAFGDMFFDNSENWTVNSIDGDTSTIDIFFVAAHELGHSLGLDHTFVPNSLMNPFYQESLIGPQADDIAGMQFLYGAPVPFEFSPALGLTALGGLWGLNALNKKRIQKKIKQS